MGKAQALLRICKSLRIREHLEMYLEAPPYQLTLALYNLHPSRRDGVFGFSFYYFILCRWHIPKNVGYNFKLVTLPQIYCVLFHPLFGGYLSQLPKPIDLTEDNG